jgi:membrane protease YdiL (CAAX protease family)
MEQPTPLAPEQPPPEAPRRTWGLRDIAYGLALPFSLWATALGLSFMVEAPEEDTIDEAAVIAGLILTIVLDVILLGLAVGFSVWKYSLEWAALGFRWLNGNLVWVPVAGAVSAHVVVVVYSAVVTAAGADYLAPQQELEDLFESRAILPLTGVATVLAAPLAEEVFFRGFVFGGLRHRMGVVWAAIISGLLFGALHVSDAETAGLIIPFGAIGIFFAWIYHRTGSLWSTIFTHLLFNLVSFIILASLVGSE